MELTGEKRAEIMALTLRAFQDAFADSFWAVLSALQCEVIGRGSHVALKECLLSLIDGRTISILACRLFDAASFLDSSQQLPPPIPAQ